MTPALTWKLSRFALLLGLGLCLTPIASASLVDALPKRLHLVLRVPRRAASDPLLRKLLWDLDPLGTPFFAPLREATLPFEPELWSPGQGQPESLLLGFEWSEGDLSRGLFLGERLGPNRARVETWLRRLGRKPKSQAYRGVVWTRAQVRGIELSLADWRGEHIALTLSRGPSERLDLRAQDAWQGRGERFRPGRDLELSPDSLLAAGLRIPLPKLFPLEDWAALDFADLVARGSLRLGTRSQELSGGVEIDAGGSIRARVLARVLTRNLSKLAESIQNPRLKDWISRVRVERDGRWVRAGLRVSVGSAGTP